MPIFPLRRWRKLRHMEMKGLSHRLTVPGSVTCCRIPSPGWAEDSKWSLFFIVSIHCELVLVECLNFPRVPIPDSPIQGSRRGLFPLSCSLTHKGPWGVTSGSTGLASGQCSHCVWWFPVTPAHPQAPRCLPLTVTESVMKSPRIPLQLCLRDR